MLMQISPEHDALVIKDRTGKYQDEVIPMPDEEFGKGLGEWLKDGASVKASKKAEPKDPDEIPFDVEPEPIVVKEPMKSITVEEIVETSDNDILDLFKKKCFDAGLTQQDLKFFGKRFNINPKDVNSIINFLKDNDLEAKVKEYKKGE